MNTEGSVVFGPWCEDILASAADSDPSFINRLSLSLLSWMTGWFQGLQTRCRKEAPHLVGQVQHAQVGLDIEAEGREAGHAVLGPGELMEDDGVFGVQLLLLPARRAQMDVCVSTRHLTVCQLTPDLLFFLHFFSIRWWSYLPFSLKRQWVSVTQRCWDEHSSWMNMTFKIWLGMSPITVSWLKNGNVTWFIQPHEMSNELQ